MLQKVQCNPHSSTFVGTEPPAKDPPVREHTPTVTTSPPQRPPILQGMKVVV